MKFVDPNIEHLTHRFLEGAALTHAENVSLANDEFALYDFLSTFNDEEILAMDDARFCRFVRIVPIGMMGRLYAQVSVNDTKIRSVGLLAVKRSKKTGRLYGVAYPPF